MMKTIPSLRLSFIFSILSALCILSVFYRVSNAVIAPALVRDFGLDAKTLGILGSAFFYSFALLQIPMGPMLDRIGPRIVITCLTLIGALGACVFAYCESFTTALLGRILMGAGMAIMMMGSLKVLTLKFPREKFSSLMGIIFAVAQFGYVLGASPLAYLTSAIGWRMTFILFGGVTTILAFLAFSILGREEKKSERPVILPSFELEVGIFQTVRHILRSLTFWQIGTVAFFRYGTLLSLQGLWFGPYLINIKGYSTIQAGNVLTMLAIGMILGSALIGRLYDKTCYSKKDITQWGLSLYSLSLIPLIGILEIRSFFWYGFIFFLIGFFSSFGMGVFSHVKEIFPINMSGTVLAWINFFSMAGVAVFMQVLGRIIGFFPRTGNFYPAKAFHLSFFICFLGMGASLVFYAFSESKSSNLHTASI